MSISTTRRSRGLRLLTMTDSHYLLCVLQGMLVPVR